jgi:hypothetical protein
MVIAENALKRVRFSAVRTSLLAKDIKIMSRRRVCIT